MTAARQIRRFVFPTTSEIQTWGEKEITEVALTRISSSDFEQAAARVRRTRYQVVYTALVPSLIGWLAAAWLSKSGSALNDAQFWVLVCALALLVTAATFSWRTIVSARAPEQVSMYYAAACIDRLRGGGLRRGDSHYLQVVLSASESVLLSTALNRRAAGTSGARARVAGVQAGLAGQIGLAEEAWRKTRTEDAARELGECIGRALVVVTLRAWFTCNTQAQVGQNHSTVTFGTPPKAAGTESLLTRTVETTVGKGMELLLSASGSAVVLLIAGAR